MATTDSIHAHLQANTSKDSDESAKPFNRVVFFISRESGISDADYERTRQELLTGGATEAKLTVEPEGNRRTLLDFLDLTHIIANNIDFPEYLEADERMINVVKSAWVHKSSNQRRSLPLRMFSPNPRFFFSDVSIVAVGLPASEVEAIYGGVQALGGQWSTSISRFTTHIVTPSIDNPGFKEIASQLAKRPSVKIVLPHWVDYCLKLHRHIKEDMFLFPDPPIWNRGDGPLSAAKKSRSDLFYIHPGHIEEEDARALRLPEARESSVFRGKKFYLAQDLNLSEHFKMIVGTMIRTASGEVVDILEDANVYLGRWRAGEDYIKASRSHIFVGSLLWLYWMIAHDTWKMPLRHLLHYPVPRDPIPEMKGFKISVSGFTGESRLYVERLILGMGAEYTRTLRQDTTHLIIARTANSTKYEAALEWGTVHILNHLWLEDSYVRWECQRVSNPRYTTFPAKMNLMDVIGQTRLDVHELMRFYEPEEGEEGVVEESVEKEKEEEAKDVVINNEKAQAESSPTSKRTLLQIDNNVGTPKPAISKTAERSETPSADPSESASSTKATPTPARKSKAVSENEPRATPATETPTSSPFPSGRRAAKDKAAVKLKGDMEQLNDYEKQKKKKHGGLVEIPELESGDSVAEPAVASGGKKRKSEEGGESTLAKKKAKGVTKERSVSKEPRIKVLLTGYGDISSHDAQTLLSLNIEVVEDPKIATHVASPKLLRTEKFLCAIAHGPTIISTDFIKDTLARQKPLDANKYLLKDKEGEKRNKCVLAETLARAKKLDGAGVFCGMAINVTPGVKGGAETIRRIVLANGGCVV
ncbi:hypothetical protein BZA70DRAFT_291621 [Myxozyma melibiosi]|uniref:BRCT domain-containing protein n=1 Tax=Myxozyma melibiosi TaxID=54550 RepID=A0ABR1F013_9ASCO